jgi:flagellar motor switch protein FliM
MQYQVYDFASSARVERPLWLAFNHWMQKFAELFAEHWCNFSQSPLQATPLAIDAHDFELLQEGWGKPAFGVGLSLNDESVTGMLILDRVELLTLLMDILGSGGTDPVIDRELTPVETSLCELIFEQSVTTLVEGWPQQALLSYEMGELFEQPNRSRMFAPDKKMLVSGLHIQLPQASVKLELLLAKEEAAKLMGIEKRKIEPPNRNNRLSQEKIAEINVRVSAEIGTTELPMTDLVSIAVGDIIVFDQHIDEPITVFANQEPVFCAWPGRTANKQSLKIVSTLI